MAKITYPYKLKNSDLIQNSIYDFTFKDANEVKNSINFLHDVVENNASAGVLSINSKIGNVVLNTSDIAESSNLYYTDSRVSLNPNVINGQTAFSWGNHSELYIPTSAKGAINGVATLGSTGKLSASELPSLILVDTFVVPSQSAMLALSTAEQGDVAIRTDIQKTFILADSNNNTLSSWKEMLSPTDSVASVNGYNGVVNLTTTHINEGLNLYYTDSRVTTLGNTLYAPLTGYNNTNWNTAYSWGNHASVGYSTSSNTQTFTNKTWNGGLIADAYISSASTWNAKQNALGFTPYNATNPAGYITSSALSPYQLSAGLGSNAYSSTAYLPTAGGTLTGALIGTTAIFSSTTQSESMTLGSLNNVKFAVTYNSSYGLYMGIGGSGNAWLQVGRQDANTAAYNLVLQPNGGNVGIGTVSPTQKLDVVGNGIFSGTVTANGTLLTSDIRLKDLVKYNYNKQKVFDLLPINYTWKETKDNKKHIGYSAQEVLQVLPDAVNINDMKQLSVNYIEVLVAKVAVLEERIRKLENNDK